jgi:AmmeMemoRadiSam system protein A
MQITERASGRWSPELTDGERQTLFAIALETLAWCVDGGGGGTFDMGRYELTERLKAPMATFVTLNEGGMLRGCIGSLAAVAPLFQSIHDNAVQAALHDPRFPAVTMRELPMLEVHLSLLSPIKPISGVEAFRLGEHGIILTKGYARSVYLPEVAVEQGWSLEETLCSLSQKAGLAADGWREGATFEVFSSVVLENHGIASGGGTG